MRRLVAKLLHLKSREKKRVAAEAQRSRRKFADKNRRTREIQRELERELKTARGNNSGQWQGLRWHHFQSDSNLSSKVSKYTGLRDKEVFEAVVNFFQVTGGPMRSRSEAQQEQQRKNKKQGDEVEENEAVQGISGGDGVNAKKRKDGTSSPLTVEDKYLITLLILRTGLSMGAVAGNFSVSVASVSRYFETYLVGMYRSIQEYFPCPTKEVLEATCPQALKDKFGYTTVSYFLDATEIFIQTPDNERRQELLFWMVDMRFGKSFPRVDQALFFNAEYEFVFGYFSRGPAQWVSL